MKSNKHKINENLHFPLKLFIVLVIIFLSRSLYAQDPFQIQKQKAFESVFGDAVLLDPIMVEKVTSDTPRHYVDTNGDGKLNEVWFIDTDSRHNDRNRPILVKVIDENNNLEYGHEPDKYGDLWIADWHADGLFDAVIGYEDTDGYNDLDQMGMYFVDRKNGLRVWWFIDDGDDNLLGYDIDYIYYQIPCQNHTHFGGNESLISMYFNTEKKIWIPFWENPFLFYDSDDDGITEEVVRIEGEGDVMRFLRWSFNVNPTEGQLRNYDVGITACAPGWTKEKDRNSDFTLRLSDNETDSFELRGFLTGSVIKRSTARENLKSVQWARVLMTWDENDLNTAWDRQGDIIERWEGIISACSKEPGFYMPQVGGPDCGPFNKRYELVLQPAGHNQFYFNPSDKRIHIRNSDRTWIKVDYNGDLKTDLFYLWKGTDNDGIVDRLEIDLNGNNQVDDWYDLDVSDIREIEWDFKDFNKMHLPVLKNELENKYYLIQSLFIALKGICIDFEVNSIWTFLEKRLIGEGYSDELAERLLNSDESVLFYLNLVQDHLIVELKNSGVVKTSFWDQFNSARSKGDTKAMTTAVGRYFGTKIVEDFDTWLSRLRKKEDRPRVAWDNQWLPPNWGWESEKIGYRFYDGHFDLFGKRQDTLIYPQIKEGKDYHRDNNVWGMDILHGGKSSGTGGLSLIVNGQLYPVRTEKHPDDPVFTSRLISESNDKIELEFVAQNVGPMNNPFTVRIKPSIVAGETKSSVGVDVEGGGDGDEIQLGVGLTRLKQESFAYNTEIGFIANWGIQEPEIGWIGLGVLFDPEKFLRVENDKHEHRVVVNYEKNETITFCITGEWLKGNRFPCCSSPTDWFEKFKKIICILKVILCVVKL